MKILSFVLILSGVLILLTGCRQALTSVNRVFETHSGMNTWVYYFTDINGQFQLRDSDVQVYRYRRDMTFIIDFILALLTAVAVALLIAGAVVAMVLFFSWLIPKIIKWIEKGK